MRLATYAFLCALVLGCASRPQVDIVRPQMALVQLVGPGDFGYPGGSVDIHYGLQVKNQAIEPITLRSLTIESVGDSGAYRITRSEHRFAQTIEQNQVKQVEFWARAQAAGGRLEGTEPARVRVVAHFESAAGAFTQILTQTLGQGMRDRD
ncbi:MAG TPA: hypothetical protein VF618_10680 [Thermoanaerobaculia bacterium]